MTASKVIMRLSNKGLGVELSVKLFSRDPETFPVDEPSEALLREHKSLVIEHLVAQHKPLSPQHQAMIKAAADGLINVSVPGVSNANTFVIAWASTYLVSTDKEHALENLNRVLICWQASL